MTISPGSRVAVVGRTGSGKSSLLRVLLRINDYHSGTVTLSGVELRSIPKHRLRSRLSVIPQNPLLFSGTIKFNLDPLGEYSEEELCAALDLCKIAQTTIFAYNSSNTAVSGSVSGSVPQNERPSEMTDRFTDVTLRSSSSITRIQQTDPSQEKLRELLQFELKDGGDNLSLGQQQLLCLARAVLRRSDLILVDEATAAIDAHTEKLLYASLAEYVQMTGASMLMVCHKIGGINKVCNKVIYF